MTTKQKKQKLLYLMLLTLFFIYFKETEQATISPTSYEDEENSSSAEQDNQMSVEISLEVVQDDVRRRRSTDLSVADNNEIVSGAKAAIPGLPDPATIIKIGQLLQTISDQVIPIIVEGITSPAEIVTQQFNKDLQLVKQFKRRLDIFNAQFRMT